MKEDILEQLVDDYLQSQGYFTRHNIKFRPRPDHPDYIRDKDSNHSDIDVLGFHPHKKDSAGVETHQPFVRAMEGNPIRMIDLTEMLDHIQKLSTTTVASSDIGRVLQLMRAAQKGKKALVAALESQSED